MRWLYHSVMITLVLLSSIGNALPLNEESKKHQSIEETKHIETSKAQTINDENQEKNIDRSASTTDDEQEKNEKIVNSNDVTIDETALSKHKSLLDQDKHQNQLEKDKVTSRQSSSSSADDDDDDDDDDEDEDDLGLDDDDDDDDDDDEEDGGTAAAAADDEDDDDDEDYFERLFDDILGDDDDEDDDEDDDDVSPSTGSQPVVASQPPQSIDNNSDISSNINNNEEQDTPEDIAPAGETDLPNESASEVGGDLTENEAVINKDPSEQQVAETNQNSVQEQPPHSVVVQPVAADTTSVDDDDDDDDDDEDDDTGLGLDDDDDDEDDENTAADDDEEDDDDDDDDDIEDVLEAKRSRSLDSLKDHQQDRQGHPEPKMPAIYISKYNRFVDNIISRINRILGKSYDPVRVKLESNEAKKKQNSKIVKKKKSQKKRTSSSTNGSLRNKLGDLTISGRSTESEAREPAFILIAKNGKTHQALKNVTVKIETRASTKSKKKQSAVNKTSTNKTKLKKEPSSKKGSKARATLFGLSSIKRDGDVTVNMMSDHTTVKTNFILGPLTLRVEREFGRGGRKELKSATATTAEMYGRLNLKIIHGGAATMQSIKVLQPKQVRVDSAENHEKTKEFLWKRSSHIATVVSQKLAAAARSMLKTPSTS